MVLFVTSVILYTFLTITMVLCAIHVANVQQKILFFFIKRIKEALKKVASDGQARRNQMKKRSLQDVNEHFESDFNTA